MLYNYNYGTLNELNNIVYAPKNIRIGDTWYIPALPEDLTRAGYYEIQTTPYPQDDKTYDSRWEIQEDKIVQVWYEVPAPIDPRTPAEKREEQYETKLCIVFPENSNDLITIDDGVKLVYEYQCENTEVAASIVTYLKAQITEQKAIIRQEIPDEE